jgi:hypothetical protein
MGEIFVEVPKDEAEQLLEKATSKLGEVCITRRSNSSHASGEEART